MNTKSKTTINLSPMLILSGIALLIAFGLSAYAWAQIPAGEQIPVHWGVNGEPDRYGGKFEGLMLLPLVMIGTVALLAIVPSIDPRKTNLARSRTAYFATWGGTLLFFLVMHVAIILTVLGRPVNIGVIVPVFVGVLFLLIGNFMGKVRSNYMFGIRTPWTLASEESWNKTHRLGGRLFVIFGLALILAALFATPVIAFGIVIGGVFIILGVVMVYSYVVWKNDPQAKPN